MTQITDVFTLQEIADWQLKPEDSIVELPSVQRGFVWKPKQIEDLWDSILRGYPIGSLMFSNTGTKLFLMDGQQRATSIFLGHFNPFNPSEAMRTWVLKGELPTIWIDIKPNTKPETSKYLIRVTTRSHPWGYQASKNDTKLSLSDRRKALKLFKEHVENKNEYTSFKNSTTFPFDACYPLPLSFFIESDSADEVIKKAELYLPEYFSTKEGCFQNKSDFVSLLQNDLRDSVETIFDVVKRTSNLKIKSNIIADAVLNEENEVEDPTLFVRINSSGTTLTGDDLIYSIYKAIFPEAKNLIERIGLNFIAPTQILSLISRIVASDLDNNSYVKKMTVKDFQRRMKNDDFRENLKNLIETNKIEKIFAQAIAILSCKENQQFDGEVPPVIIKQFMRKNQDLFLFFVYWLHINQQELTAEIELKMTAKLLLFAWFDFGNVPQLWKEKVKNVNFWSEPLNELVWWNGTDGIHFPIKPDLLREYYLQPQIEQMFIENNEHKWGLWEEGVGVEIRQYYNAVKSQEFDLPTANEYFWKFINIIRHNKQLILFAQRDYINSTFGDYNQMDDIEDTNVPWDWDHIYPSEYVYRKGNCNQGIRDWNNSNGNFRAISLEQNRSESNTTPPNKRLADEELKMISFVKNDWEYWQNIGGRICDDKVQNHFRAITTRMINIYDFFWNSLKISDLLKE